MSHAKVNAIKFQNKPALPVTFHMISYFCRLVRGLLSLRKIVARNLKFLSKYILVLLVFPVLSHAQTDTISDATLQRFANNLRIVVENRDDQNSAANPFSREKIVFPDFEEGFEQNGPSVFRSELATSEVFYAFLKNLKPAEKQTLVMSFGVYEPFFNAALEEANLPDDLKYFAPAISAMNPIAVGVDKRAGLWQLEHFQALMNGLQVDRMVDERFDPTLSTQAFIRQIQKNVEVFGSVEKAVLAYFAGNVKVRNILDEKGKQVALETIMTRLPGDVLEQIAAFQAITVFLKANPVTPEELQKKDTVFVHKQLHLKQVAQVLNVPQEELERLNPQYPYSIIPEGKNDEALFLPEGKYNDFVLWQDSIFSVGDSTLFELITQKIEYPPSPTRQYAGERVKDLEIEGKTKIKYVIQTGDVLGFIAEDYDVRVADLKYWNNIYNERKIRAGATLDIFVDDENADYYKGLQKQVAVSSAGVKTTQQKVFEIPENAQKIEHVVKSGESPYVIAKKYEGVTPEAILFWNGISDARKIQIGQKLILYLKR